MAVSFAGETTELGVRYVLEHRKGGTAEGRMHELSWVERADIDDTMSASAQYPINETKPPIVQRSLTRKWSITLAGATGVEERLSSNALGRAESLDGLGRIAALRAFLAEFVDEAAHQQGAFARTSKVDELYLHVIYEGLSYQLLTCDLQRTVSIDQAIGDFVWNIRCTAIKLVSRELPPQLPLTRLYDRSIEWDTDRDNAAATYKEAADAERTGSVGRSTWDDLYGPLDTARLAVEKGTFVLQEDIAPYGARARGAISRVNLLLQRVSELGDGARRIAQMPAALIASALKAVADAIEELGESALEIGRLPSDLIGKESEYLYHDLAATYGDVYTLWGGVLAALRLPVNLMADSALRQVSAPADTALGGSLVVLGQLVRTVFTMEGESILDLANRVLGDPDRWPEIAEVNGLPDAWSLRDGSPFSAGGAILLVPDPNGVAVPRTGDAVDLIGEAFYLDPTTSDLVMRAGGFQRIRGLPLVIQAIRERARNTRGTTLAAPEWGMLRLVGNASSRESAVRFAVDARAQFFRDPRILSVENVVLSQTGDTVILTFDIETVGIEDPVTVTAPFAVART